MADTDACSETTNQNKSADQSEEATSPPAAGNSSPPAAESQSDKIASDQNKLTDVNGSDSRRSSSEIPASKDDSNINETDNETSSGPVTSPPPKLQIKLPSPSDKIKILLKPAGEFKFVPYSSVDLHIIDFDIRSISIIAKLDPSIYISYHIIVYFSYSLLCISLAYLR